MDSAIGEQISFWKEKLLTINQNIMDLNDLSSSKMLEDNLNTGNYIGLTEKKASECVRIIDKLLQNYFTLSKVIEKAQDLYNKSTIFRSYDDEINFLLNGKSITLYKEDIPINNRELLYDKNKGDEITPKETLEIMAKDFERAKLDLNSIIEGEENTIKICSKMREEINELKLAATSLGKDERVLDRYISSLEYCEKDPIVGVTQIQEISKEIYKFRDELYKSLKNSEELNRAIEEYSSIIERIKRIVEVNNNFIVDNKEILGKLVSYRIPEKDEKLQEFHKCIEDLKYNLSLKRISDVNIGVNKLSQQLEAKLKDETDKLKENREKVECFNELKGRHTALEAKINIMHMKGHDIPPKVLEMLITVKEKLQSSEVDLLEVDELLKKLYIMMK
ncbi:hypothetical protein [Clostridium sp.]|uniref:hypothetical protein n=1 Tax=Clostridium sp. TaxID=1506 RepID=UPI00283E6AD3|nr:hypothetical protein [Clostridium sp.]MDR3598205.1 hypothetical protein [Clostridium sp.]